jgi:hypothetical protein
MADSGRKSKYGAGVYRVVGEAASHGSLPKTFVARRLNSFLQANP